MALELFALEFIPQVLPRLLSPCDTTYPDKVGKEAILRSQLSLLQDPVELLRGHVPMIEKELPVVVQAVSRVGIAHPEEP